MRALPLLISLVALGVAVLAYAKSPDGLESMPGRGLSAYDVTDPKAAWLAQLAMQGAADFRAMSEYALIVSEERRRTAEVVDTAPLGERVILFIRHQEDGKTKQTTRGMRKVTGHEAWTEDYVSSYEVRGEDKDLAQRMKDWEDGGEK